MPIRQCGIVVMKPTHVGEYFDPTGGSSYTHRRSLALPSYVLYTETGIYPLTGEIAAGMLPGYGGGMQLQSIPASVMENPIDFASCVVNGTGGCTWNVESMSTGADGECWVHHLSDPDSSFHTIVTTCYSYELSTSNETRTVQLPHSDEPAVTFRLALYSGTSLRIGNRTFVGTSPVVGKLVAHELLEMHMSSNETAALYEEVLKDQDRRAGNFRNWEKDFEAKNVTKAPDDQGGHFKRFFNWVGDGLSKGWNKVVEFAQWLWRHWEWLVAAFVVLAIGVGVAYLSPILSCCFKSRSGGNQQGSNMVEFLGCQPPRVPPYSQRRYF